jgi:hypothetical protein
MQPLKVYTQCILEVLTVTISVYRVFCKRIDDVIFECMQVPLVENMCTLKHCNTVYSTLYKMHNALLQILPLFGNTLSQHAVQYTLYTTTVLLDDMLM